MRRSGARLRVGDFGGDDVQRNLFATPEVAGYRLAHARGSDNLHPEDVNLHPEDVNFVSDSIVNSNSPAFPEALSGAQAARVQIDSSEALGVSGVASRADARRPLDSSVVGTCATPSSGYLDAMRVAGVIKAARRRDIRGDAPDGAIRDDAAAAEATPLSLAPPSTIDETPHSDPLQLHEYAVSGQGRGLAPSSRGPSQSIAPSRGRGRGGMSVSPRTEGLCVRWPSGTVEGRGLVPTNLFGQDESCVLAQFRAFVRQVPDSEVGKRCASLVAVFSASQKRSELKVPYELWVNPQGLFVRVQVKYCGRT
jgi:hypothetical protein